ncbi:MAG: glycosyltransferase [Candidatus Andersenbacteria bacterium]|nr:glycosyltransferase [Candidatus Andersenbacteria bacterium]
MGNVPEEQSVVLSICIPTYNRPNQLRRLLQSIRAQYDNRIEVVIGDDGNAEDTKKVLQEFSDIRIVYFINEPRKGFAQNLLAVSWKAVGEYIWWISDDDQVAEGALGRVFEHLKMHPPILWVNAESGINPGGEFKKNATDGYLPSKDAGLEEIGTLLTFISSIIFQKEKLLALNQDELRQFEHSSFVNFAIVAMIMLTCGPIYCIAKPCVIAHWDFASDPWKNKFRTFGIDFLDVMNHFKDRFSSRAYRAIVGSMFSFSWRVALGERFRSGNSLHQFMMPMIRRYWSYPEILLAVPLFLMPRFGIVLLYRLYGRLQ